MEGVLGSPVLEMEGQSMGWKGVWLEVALVGQPKPCYEWRKSLSRSTEYRKSQKIIGSQTHE